MIDEELPQGIGTVARGDVLHHHTQPGAYVVAEVTPDGHVVLLDPGAERRRVWADYVAVNFRRAQR